jgi:hypothetical protein
MAYRLDIEAKGWRGNKTMRVYPLLCAALVAAMMPVSAWADDPHDPAMRSAAARARDRAMIRQLNLNEAARVRERDARYAQGWRATAQTDRDYAEAGDDYSARSRSYARDRAQYERDMAAWRRAVAACRAGDYSACD